jgi:hypothetical protein
MTTIVQYVPKWLRVRLQKPTQPKSKTVNKKDRQVLPTLLDQKRPSAASPEDIKPAAHWLLWRI